MVQTSALEHPSTARHLLRAAICRACWFLAWFHSLFVTSNSAHILKLPLGPEYSGLAVALAPLQHKINVMTDCEGLKIIEFSFPINIFELVAILSGGSGAESPIWALQILLDAIGKKDLLNHVSPSCSNPW